MNTRYIKAVDLKNDKITSLKALPTNYQENDYIIYMAQSQVIVLRVEDDDEGTITDIHAERNKAQLGETYDTFKDYINLVDDNHKINFRKVQINGE